MGAKFACPRDHAQSQRGQAMQPFGTALMNGAEQAGLHDDAGVGDTDAQQLGHSVTRSRRRVAVFSPGSTTSSSASAAASTCSCV